MPLRPELPAALGHYVTAQATEGVVGRTGRAVVRDCCCTSLLYTSADPLLAKEVAAPAEPAAVQVTSNIGCSVNNRESPWVTLLTGTYRARPDRTAGGG